MTDHAELRLLLNSVPKGVWSWEGEMGAEFDTPTLYIDRTEHTHGYNVLGRLDDMAHQGPAVLDLICAAINALPALLDELGRECMWTYTVFPPTGTGGLHAHAFVSACGRHFSPELPATGLWCHCGGKVRVEGEG